MKVKTIRTEKQQQQFNNMIANFWSCQSVELNDVYSKASEAKKEIFKSCLETFETYSGTRRRITSFNKNIFVFDFLGIYEGKEAFFRIAPTQTTVYLMEK